MSTPSIAIQRRLRGGTVPTFQPSPDIAAGQPPSFRAPTPVMPAADITPTPSIDVKGLMSQLDVAAGQQPPSNPVREAIGRALYGFSRGMAATPREAGYAPLKAGILGGLSGTGQVMEEQRQQDNASRAASLEPRRQFLKALTDQAAKSAVEDPYKQAEDARREAGQQSLAKLKAKLTGDLMNDEATKRASDKGISTDDFLRLRKEAAKSAFAQGLDFESPGYQGFIDQEVDRLASKAKKTGVHGVVPGAAQPAAPKGSLPGIE
jgi:hypothetical protein